jgi:hypothetical protein
MKADKAFAQLISPSAHMAENKDAHELAAPTPAQANIDSAPVQLAPTPPVAPNTKSQQSQQQQSAPNMPHPKRQMSDRPVAVLQVLDKVSARVTTLRVPVGQSAAFGLIHITVRSCQVALPADMPEAVAFLEIGEINPRRLGQIATTSADQLPLDRQQVFSGWMFASSPAISALEHPTYDVVVLGCSAGIDEKTPIEQRIIPQDSTTTTEPPAAALSTDENDQTPPLDD